MAKAKDKSPKKSASKKYQEKLAGVPNVFPVIKQNKKGKDQKLKDKSVKDSYP